MHNDFTPHAVPYPDGLRAQLTPVVQWRLTSEGRTHGGLILGKAGAGKSILARRLARIADANGMTVHFADINGGVALDGDIATYRDVTDICQMIELTGKEIDARRRAMGNVNGSHRRHLVIIDDASPVLADRPTKRRIESIARTGPTVGVAIVLTGQLRPHDIPTDYGDINTVALPMSYRTDASALGFPGCDLRGPLGYFRPAMSDTVIGFELRL